jgi:hypothetical protein
MDGRDDISLVCPGRAPVMQRTDVCSWPSDSWTRAEIVESIGLHQRTEGSAETGTSIAQEHHVPRSRRFQRRAHVVRIARHGEGRVEGAARPAAAFRDGLSRRTLALADATAAGIVVLGLLPLLNADALLASVLLAIPTMVLVSKLGGLNQRDELVLNKSTLDEAPRLLQLGALFSLLLWLFHDGFTSVVLSSGDVMVIWAASFILLLALRGLARWSCAAWRPRSAAWSSARRNPSP